MHELPVGEIRLLTFAVISVILLGALVIYAVDRWRRRPPIDQRSLANEQLSQFRAWYEQGELTREEYETIRSRLSQRLRRELDLPERPAAVPEPPPSPTPPEKSPPETQIRPG
ncbi:MAG: hypothetical protein NZ700_14750 [Gemmataceae bacterium]|nr:hypothetical protein [Gemmataceae bacterium]MDW8263861.1 hypothetical protein [Gemmataceae bacterium]